MASAHKSLPFRVDSAVRQPLALLNGRRVGKGTRFDIDLMSKPNHEIPEQFLQCGPWVQVADIRVSFNDDSGWLLAHAYSGHLARFHQPFGSMFCSAPCCSCTYSLSTYTLSDLVKNLSPEELAKPAFEALLPDIYDDPKKFFRTGLFEVRSHEEIWQDENQIRCKIQKVLKN